MKSSRAEIASTLTFIAVIVMTAGIFLGANASRLKTTSTTFAANTCAYSFSTPSLMDLDGRLICTVPTSGKNIPSIGCSLARDNTWAADSRILESDGSTTRFELDMKQGHTPGMYELIAYEFDQYCSHPDQSIRVSVSASAFAPKEPTSPPATPTSASSPTPSPVPACVSRNQGTCTSQALCFSNATNQSLGDLGCSVLRSDMICCTNAAGEPLQPTIPDETIVLTNTPAPTDTVIPTQPLSNASSVSVVSKTCTEPISVVTAQKQAWAIKSGKTGTLDVVPVIGSTDKQLVVDAECK